MFFARFARKKGGDSFQFRQSPKSKSLPQVAQAELLIARITDFIIPNLFALL
jgi:hypothetical protein